MNEYDLTTHFEEVSEEEIVAACEESNKLAVKVLKECNGSVIQAGLILSGASLVPVAMSVIMSPLRKKEIFDSYVDALRNDFEKVLTDWQSALLFVDRNANNNRPC